VKQDAMTKREEYDGCSRLDSDIKKKEARFIIVVGWSLFQFAAGIINLLLLRSKLDLAAAALGCFSLLLSFLCIPRLQLSSPSHFLSSTFRNQLTSQLPSGLPIAHHVLSREDSL
jgi:hypothetical protein